MVLWERGIRAGLVGDMEAEGAAREDSTAMGENEEDIITMKFRITVLLGKLQQSVRQATNMEEGGFVLPDDISTKTRQLGYRL